MSYNHIFALLSLSIPFHVTPFFQLCSLEISEKAFNLGADYTRRAGPLSRANSVCRDLGTSVKHTKNQLRDNMEKFQPG